MEFMIEIITHPDGTIEKWGYARSARRPVAATMAVALMVHGRLDWPSKRKGGR